jgi:threonine dehydrogenase-like Zn-dependent dehydrogenase
VCGSDLWSYRGINPVTEPSPTGHEYCGPVEEVGRDVTMIRPGQFTPEPPDAELIPSLLLP